MTDQNPLGPFAGPSLGNPQYGREGQTPYGLPYGSPQPRQQGNPYQQFPQQQQYPISAPKSSRVVPRVIAALIGLLVTPVALYLMSNSGERLYVSVLAMYSPVFSNLGRTLPDLLLVTLGVILIVAIAACARLSSLAPLIGSVWTLPSVVLPFLPGTIAGPALYEIAKFGQVVTGAMQFVQSGGLIIVGWTLLALGLVVAVRRHRRRPPRAGVALALVGSLVAAIAGLIAVALLSYSVGEQVTLISTYAAFGRFNVMQVLTPILLLVGFALWLVAVGTMVFSRWPGIVLGVCATVTGIVFGIASIELLPLFPNVVSFPIAFFTFGGGFCASGISLIVVASFAWPKRTSAPPVHPYATQPTPMPQPQIPPSFGV
jgi:hypothetical protein